MFAHILSRFQLVFEDIYAVKLNVHRFFSYQSWESEGYLLCNRWRKHVSMWSD